MATDQKRTDIGSRFGIRTPPLLDYLQGILRGYSDGQILKELLQNAEDAGATVVQFLYDENHYAGNRLLKPRLKDFQGPSLCSYNNAVFTKQDWDAIQTPAQSKKKNNALKVGRFGIGFSSVYHLTDLPCIMSQQHLAMIDPFERYFMDEDGRRSSGCKWNLRDIIHDEAYVDQLKPIREAHPLEIEFGDQDNFAGTFFRFPLRTSGSELSSSVYSRTKTLDLLKAFEEDASIVLLFLRNIESVEIFHKPENVESSKPYLKVFVDHTNLNELRSTRETFCSALQEIRETSNCASNIGMTTCFDIMTHTEHSSTAQKWVVQQDIVFECSEQIKQLYQKLKFLPWIGVAIPMFQQDISCGRTFCFFPLPPGEESESGLPVHVHGFFGVKDDRRSLKWPGGDQIQNKEAEWNKLIVDGILPEVYRKALLQATQISSDCKIDQDVVYNAFPDARRNLGHWRTAVESLYSVLFNHPVLYCHANGRWMRAPDVFILPEDLFEIPQIQKVVLKCLQLHELCVIVYLPAHVRYALVKFCSEINYVTPQVVIDCVRGETLEEFSQQERLYLLLYLLESERRAKDLKGLPLVPTDEGGFIPFADRPSSSDIVFMDNQSCPRHLLPTLQHKFLLGKTTGSLRQLWERFQIMATSNAWKQFKYVTANEIVQLLPTALPKWWSDSDCEVGHWVPSSRKEPNINWLQQIWQFISTNRVDLFELKGLKLLPVTELTKEPIKMLAVMKGCKILHQPAHEELPPSYVQVRKVLETLGVTVCTLPEYVKSCHQIFKASFVHVFDPIGVLKIFHLFDCQFIENVCLKDKTVQGVLVDKLLPYISGTTFTATDRKLLRKLPIFVEDQELSGNTDNRMVSLDDCQIVVESKTKDLLPNIRIDKACIHIPNSDVLYLVRKLGVNPKSYEDLLLQILRNAKSKMYSQSEIQLLFDWVKDKYQKIKNIEGVCSLLCKLRFVPNEKNKLKRPNEVFDTSDNLIRLLIHEKELLPQQSFLERWRDILLELGLKTRSQIHIDHVRKAAENIEAQRDPKEAAAVLEYLCHFPKCLSSNKRFCDFMKYVPFLTCRKQRPANYPESMPFYDTKDSLLKPCDVVIYSEETCHLVGAVVPLVENIFETNVVHLLDIPLEPNIEDVISQLTICISGPPAECLETTLHYIYAFLNKAAATDETILHKFPEKWIYVDNQFLEPKRMYREGGVGTPDLRPILCVLPREMRKYNYLLSAAGIPDKVDTDVNVLLRVLHELNDEFSVAPERKLAMSVDILRKLQELPGDVLEDDDIKQRLLIPSRCDPIKLLPPDRVCYCDVEWLMQGMNADDLELEEDEDPLYIVNDNISPYMAERLGVVPLSQRVLGADEVGGIKQTGQFEALTVRLKNILRNGYQPEAIPKEMVQNAEDAGASEVKFLLDLRENRDTMKRLLDPSMEDVQGPAFWVYNDATFTEEDLINITKLGSGTKSEDGSKIGQFGLGFNSVYHLTDVPSFVTRDVITYFDPHKSYLKRQIRGNGTGIQLNFLSSSSRMRRFRDQFLPYEGIFGCNLIGQGGMKPTAFQGTLFRLPLRNAKSARRSDICPESYSEDNMKPLLSHLCDSAVNMLLFTEKVSSISVYLLENNASENSLLYTVKRKIVSGNNSFKELVHKSVENDQCMPSDAVVEMEFSSKWSAKGIGYYDVDEAKWQTKERWIKVASAGKGQAHRLCISSLGKASGLLPCGGVAWSPSISSGDVFCFLPLSVPQSNLPVYINGSFAVSADRRNLWRSENSQESASSLFKAKWNNALCKDVVVSSYVTLLQEKKVRECKSGFTHLNSFSLWPNSRDTSSKGDYGKVLTGFYKVVAKGHSHKPPPKVFLKNGRFLSLEELAFGEEAIQNDEAMFPVFEKIVEQLTDKVVVKLPPWVMEGFKEADCEHLVQEMTYSWVTFFHYVVFPNIEFLADNDINDLMVLALSLRDKTLLSLMKRYPCIPCDAQNGITHKMPSVLLDVDTFKEMFSQDEEVFPASSFLENLDSYQLETLREIGCMRKDLSSEEMLQRAKTVQSLWEVQEEFAMKRASALLKYIGSKMRKSKFEKTFSSLSQNLQEVAFLPAVLGDEDVVLVQTKHIYPSDKKSLIGEVCFILSDRIKMPSAASAFLKIKDKTVQFKDVSKNVQMLKRRQYRGELNVTQEQWLPLYEYFQDHLGDLAVLQFIRVEKCFLIDGTFVESCKLSTHSESFKPYLYQAPMKLCTKFDKLLKAAQVKTTFNASDFIMALKRLVEEKNEEALEDDLLARVLTKVIKPLFDKANEIPSDDLADIPLPDSHKILRPSGSLCFCDLVQFQPLLSSQSYHLSHKEIPLEHAKKLGVKDVRQQMLTSYSHALPGFSGDLGESFGQREELVNRIKRIMEGYPCDFAILKELVQNADDAKATVVHFVLDCRKHPDNRVFYDGMKELQGPGILAYNDRPFSEEDIEGIQRLGEGSKGDATDKTGRYGVGFNVVYHLTDCPMFLSEKSTLCVFDPTLTFIKDATVNSPGRMFRPVDAKMIDLYADIFNCFLLFEEIRDRGCLEKGSLFRLPLRVKDSVLGVQKSISAVKSLFQQFKMEMFDSLLFLKSVREISISVIESSTKRPDNTYTVKAELSEDAGMERARFFQELSQHGKSLHLDVKDLNYITTIHDNAGNSEEWLIHQRLGVENKDHIPVSVRYANSHSSLKLVPKGGVAARLNANNRGFGQTRKIRSMAFCFLPLPVYPNLPVHVDGYFALGHEARRDLWQAPPGDVKSDWNYLLAKDVICCSYIRVIETLKDEITRSYEEVVDMHILKEKVAYYHSFFPLFPRNEEGHRRSALEEICHAFYKKIALEESTLFPAVFENELRWCSCMQLAKEKGYFYYISSHFGEKQQQDLRKLLLNVGFPILESPLEIFRAMKVSLTDYEELRVLDINPENVITFLKTDAKTLSLVDLPNDLRNTVIGNTYHLELLLSYILLQPNVALSGIPLLLTNDGVLREFDEDNPVFHTEFYPLLPKCSGEFLHRVLLDMIPSSDKCCEEMQLTDLADRLQTYLPETNFYQDEYILRERKLPTQDWLQMLWRFLNDAIVKKRSTKDELIKAFGSWCILPACNKDDMLLVPMKLAKTVLSPKFTSFHSGLKNILKRINCPFVDAKAVEDTKIFCIQFSSELDNIGDVLLVLQRQLRIEPQCFDGLQDKDYETILRYFSPGILSLSEENRNIIRSLPCFENISGNYVALSGKVYAVDATDIPEEEQDKWVPKYSVILLKKGKIPQELFDALKVEDLSDIELYKRFILPCFEFFSLETRWIHLNKIMAMIRVSENPENVVNYLKLKSTRLISHNDGSLQLAQFFQDDENPVYKEMSSEDMFPPKHPNETQQYRWKDFLRRIGLQTEVTTRQFETFLTTASHDANSNRSREEILVTYLFRSHHLHDNTSFRRLTSIPFITAANVDDRHRELHKQYEKSKVALSAVSEKHRNLVWSVEPLLPKWVTYSSCVTCGDSLKETMSTENQPALKQVISHAQTLFIGLKHAEKRQFQTCPAALKQESLLNDVITDILSFLSQKCQRSQTCGNCSDKNNCCDNCQLVSDALEEVAIVPVGNGVCFKAKRLAKNLPEQQNDKLFLFLREIPDFLKPQKNLLYCIGATETPSLFQYANALQLIAKEKENLQKNTPLYLAAQQAVEGFFICLKGVDSQDISAIKVLYLLTNDRKRPMTESNHLYFNDEITFAMRLQGFQYPLMKYLIPEELSTSRFKELLNKLGKLRPNLISENVKEIQVPGTIAPQNIIGYDCICALSQQLRNVLSWSSFMKALKLILSHEGIKDLSVHEDAFNTSFKVCCLSKIQTKLHLKDDGVIPESEADIGVLFEKGKEEQEVILYLSHNAKASLIHIQIADRFFRFFKIPVEENTRTFQAILKAEGEGDMFDTLSKLRINISGNELEEQFQAPELGSDIEEDVICLLEQNPLTDFSPEEYVGYNKTESTTEHFVYAKVIRRVVGIDADVEDKCWQYSVRYIIDIGDEIEVAAIWLYNFPRPDDSDEVPVVTTSSSTSVELYTGCGTSTSPRIRFDEFGDLEETKRKITEAIEALWKEEENIKRTGLRRLMRQWHPDKHKSENKVFAEEVFKHIRHEIERLEKGIPSGVDTAEDVRKWAQGNNYHQQQYWRNHKRRYGSRRSKRSKGSSRNWRQWSSRSFFTPPSFRRDNDEAKRWQRQARIDLEAASSLKAPFFQWSCCLCFHAVEKAVRAAQLVCGCNVSEKHTLTDAVAELKRHLDIISLISKLVQVVNKKSHYPSRRQSPSIPHDVFTQGNAIETIGIATEVLQKVDAYLEGI